MKKFIFKLEALEKKRRHIERQKQADLAQVSALYNKEESYKTKCFDSIKENITYADALDYKNEDDINIIIQVSESNVALRNRIVSHEVNMDKIKPELLRKQKILAEASKQKRAVEILREHKYKEYKKYILKEEQKSLDEWSNDKIDAMIALENI